MYIHQTHVRVRYGETDQMGYLYHGNYAQYFEIGRIDALRSLEMSYREMEEELRVMMPVMSLNMRFVRPALYDDYLTVTTELRKLPQKDITFYTEIKNAKGKLINGGSVKLCFIDADTKKRVDAPKKLVERLRPHF